MKKNTEFVCESCGTKFSKWFGQCSMCKEWNTLVERGIEVTKGLKAKPSLSDKSMPKRVKEVVNTVQQRYQTGLSELDRILGGGLVKDSIVVLTGEPGSGKSTLETSVAQNLAVKGVTVLYISGEESEGQVKSRATRLIGEDVSENFYVKSETCMDDIKIYIDYIKPNVLIIDSIQTIYCNDYLPSRAGGATQMDACTSELMAIAKNKGIAVIITSQINKKSEMVGVKSFEHAVDTVLYIEGDRKQQIRLAYCIKNRYGDTSELAIFVLTDRGMVPVENPSELFVTKRETPAIGCALTTIVEGSRTFIVEIESLVDKACSGYPIRASIDVDKEELRILTAILEKRAGLMLSEKDVYVKVTGGLRIKESSANLGIIMAIASSCKNLPITEKTVFIGEVGLTGELKSVPNIEKRINEAYKLGYSQVVVPKGVYKNPCGGGNFKISQFNTLEDIMNIFTKSKK